MSTPSPSESALAPVVRNVIAAMQARGWKPADLCREAGLDSGNVSRAFAGKRGFDLASLQKLAPALETTVGALLGEQPALPLEGGQANGVRVVERMVEVTADGTDPSVRLLRFSQLRPSPLNPRKTFDAASIAELAQSILERGLLENLVARPAPGEPDQFEVTAGGRRYRAFQHLVETGRWDPDAPSISVRIRAGEADDGEAIAIALLENLQREDVPPLEEAEAFATLRKIDPAKWTTASIAEAIHKSQRHVQLRLALVEKLSTAAKQALAEGKIQLADARALTMAPIAAQKELVKQAKDGWFQNAEDMAEQITRGLPPVDHALFDLASYRGDYIEGDSEILAKGEAEQPTRWFSDTAQFEKLQGKAIEALVDELEETHDWVIRRKGSFFNQNEFARAPKGKPGGVLVMIGHQLKVTLHKGLAKRSERAAAEPERDFDPVQAWDEQRRALQKEAMDKLRETFAAKADLNTLLRLLALDQLGFHYDSDAPMPGGPEFDPETVDAKVLTDLVEIFGEDERETERHGKPMPVLHLPFPEAWERTAGLSTARLTRLIAHALAQQLQSWRPSGRGPLNQACALLAEAVSADVPEVPVPPGGWKKYLKEHGDDE